MDEFRAEAEKVGQCLHLNHMTSSDALLQPRGANSRSDYGWTKLGDGPNYTWPETPFETVTEHSISELHKRAELYPKQFHIPYIPTISTGHGADGITATATSDTSRSRAAAAASQAASQAAG